MKLFKLSPIYKAYPWGGSKLKEAYGKTSAPAPCAESWELACHPDGECLISGGVHDGHTLSSVLLSHPDMLGTNCGDHKVSPIMVKLIDAKENLSVQVHPDNAFAREQEGQLGKTEMWYVLEHETDAFLYYGLNRQMSRADFTDTLRDGSVLDVLNKVPVKAGDTFFIDPGTVHAIGKGIVLAEIQQNSNVTYRLYDYGRLEHGQPRTLHIEKGTACANLGPSLPHHPPEGYIASCEYFSVIKRNVSGSQVGFVGDESFHLLLILSGSGTITCGEQHIACTKGDALFAAAGAGNYEIEGTLEILISFVGTRTGTSQNTKVL